MDWNPKWPHLERLEKFPLYLKDAAESNKWLNVTEKIHGFNARLGFDPEGNFWTGSRNNVNTEKTGLQGFIDWAWKLNLGSDEAPPGITFYGEWAGKGIQKGFDYGNPRFWLFAVWNPIAEEYMGRDEMEYWADEILVCEVVPCLYDDPASDVTMEMLTEWRNMPSSIDPTKICEGIVINTHPSTFDVYGNILITKYKNEEHREEREPKPWVDMTNVQAFVDMYATENRLLHVLDTITRDTAADPLHHQHMGLVLRAYYDDVVREGADDYAALSSDDQKMVGRVLNQAVKPMLDTLRAKALHD